MKHIVSKQDENQMYPCDMCEYNGSFLQDLKFHVKSKHKGGPYSCSKCGFVAINSLYLKLHIESKHEGVVAEQDPALEAAQAAVDAANNVLAALPPAPQVQQGADPTAVMLANMMHAMQMQNAQTQVHLAQARLDSERQRREDQRRFQIQLEELRRDKGSSNARVRPPQFDLDKDKASFLIWKSRWEFHVKDLDNIRDRVVRREKKRAMLQQALSDFTLKWIHNKGFTAETATMLL